MDQVIVTHVDGTTLKLQSHENRSSITKITQSVELLGADTVDITVESATKLTFGIGDKITIIGRDYTLNTPPNEKKLSERSFVYDLQFEGVQYELLRANFSVNVNTTNNQIQDLNGDALTGDMKMFLDVIISNANRVFPGKWSLGTYPANTETRNEVFGETDNCLSVLQSLCAEDKYNTEFNIVIGANGTRTLNVGPIGSVFAYTFQYGKGKGIYELVRERISSSNIITRLSAYGSSRNINTTKYRASRLCLPTKSKGQSYLEDATAIAKFGVWEKTKIFEDIYPHRTGTISAVDDFLTFRDSSMDFDLNAKDGNGNTLYLVPGTSAKVHMNSGKLAGYEFEITSYDHSTKKFKVINILDENGYSFPSQTNAAFQFSVGDKYVLIDIYLPQSYIDTAEAALQTEAQAYLNKYKSPNVQYSITEVDPFFLARIVGADVNSNIIWVGDYIPVKDTDLEIDKSLRVKSFTRDLLRNYAYSISVAENAVSVSTINRILTDLNGIETVMNINNLKDPARARRNFRATSELVTMIDTVKAEALLVGNDPASQYSLSGVAIKANYQSNPNTIYITGGTIAHNYYPVGAPANWTISAGNFADLTPGTAYYAYIKASKSAATASYFLSSTKIEVESVVGYYHFPLGVLSSVIDGARVFTTTKGYTLITGDSIKTGKIVSPDGLTYFDVSNGVLRGNFQFTSGDSVENVVNSKKRNFTSQPTNSDAYDIGDTWTNATYSTTYTNDFLRCKTAKSAGVAFDISHWEKASKYTDDTAANAAATAAANAQTSANTANSLLADIASDSKLTPVEKSSVRAEWDTIAAEKTVNDAQADTFGITTEKTTYGTKFQALATYLNNGTAWSSGVPTWIADANLSSTTDIVGATFRLKFKEYYDARTALLNAIAAKAKTLADNAQSAADLLGVSDSGAVFMDAFSETQAQYAQRWTNYSGSGNPTVTAKADATGGNALVIGDNSGNDQAWLIGSKSTPYDQNKLYMVKARVRRLAGAGTVYIGVAGRDATDTQWVNTSGGNDSSSQYYFAASNVNPGSDWTEYTGYFKGVAASSNGGYKPNPLQPGTCHTNVRYIRPLLIVNYNSQAGITEVDYVMIDYADAQVAQASADAAQTAANNAATAASNAQTSANAANSLLADISNDNKLTPVEKQSTKQEWDIIVSEKSKIDAQADVYGVSKTAYGTAYTALSEYITPLLENLTTTSEIIGTYFRINFKNYYDSRQDILNAISTAAKTYADTQVNNVVVGGKNLVLNSLETYTGIGQLHIYTLSEPLVAGQTYSVSVKGTVGSGAAFNVLVNRNLQAALNLPATGIAKGTFVFGGGAYPSEISVYSEQSANPSTVYWVKIENGNKPTDWTPAPEDVPSAMEYIASALQGSTDISGGLLATNVLLMKTLAGVITGGMSGLATDNIGFWSGGTYQNAIDAIAKIILRKDGSGQLAGGKILFTLQGDLSVGVMAVDANGTVLIKDVSAVNRVIITKNDISTLTSIENSTQNQTLNTSYASHEGISSYTAVILNSLTVNNNNSQVTLACNLESSIIEDIPPADGSTYIQLLLVNTSTGVSIEIDSMSTYGVGNNSKSVNASVIVQAGTYQVRAYFSHINYGGATFDSRVYAGTVNIFYDGSVQRTEIGKNGIGIIGNATNYSFFGKEGSVFKAVEKVSGGNVYDKPGVLASGSVASAGGTVKSWGAKVGASSNPSTGTYTINHSIGHTDYMVLVTPSAASRVGYVSTKNTTSVTIIITNMSGTATNAAFDYVIIGNNQANIV